MHSLAEPHGGELVDLMAEDGEVGLLKELSLGLPSLDLTGAQLNDLELLLNGSFSPLRGFLGEDDYDSVISEMRLSDGTLWPVPITLDVSEDLASRLSGGERLALRDAEGVMLAVLGVTDVWRPERDEEAEAVFGTADPSHPGVARLLAERGPYRVGGPLQGIHLPIHYDFRRDRLTPAEVRKEFERRGWTRIAAFLTRHMMHRAQVEMTLRIARETEANLLISPVVGMTMQGDVDHYARVRASLAILDRYPRGMAMVSLLPLAIRMQSPRQVILHAVLSKNHGCTHLIQDPELAGLGSDASDLPRLGPAVEELIAEYESELDVEMIPFRPMVYLDGQDVYLPADEVVEKTRTRTMSDSELRDRLADGREIPEWFTFPEVALELRRTYPARPRQGFTVFFTGLSGSGKSTVANALLVKLLEMGGRPVTLLDGDIVRKHMSSELGFSKEHRDLNIQRIGFVASEITKHGGIAICAPIAPYDRTRRAVRKMVESSGGFVLVHVATPLEICEQRDRKGLYAKARAGIIEQFTGISDPYEEPSDADVVVDTTVMEPDEAANRIILHLEAMGYVGGRSGDDDHGR